MEPDVVDCAEFWETSTVAGLRPEHLSTNLVARGLKDFILSFSGLEIFSISPPNITCQAEPFPILLAALRKQHSATLKVLSIRPQGASNNFLDGESLAELTDHLMSIEELRFGVDQIAVPHAIPLVMKLPQIRLLHVNGRDNGTEWTDNSLDQLRKALHQGSAKRLRYAKFGDGVTYKVLREPLQLVEEATPVGFIGDTFLFREKVFQWDGST
ncbi:hypothetical protein PITC_022550 [Penicillium italicum]|uniref:Uncharacterized protein n=1 Tax=Penicillium italicum TaxID=40296 RepID=A0A0A2KJ78_PENIT|nr:hypothetical protein PITC_022550 [Penicillium italicum]